MNKRDEHQITAVLIVGLIGLYAMWGVTELIGHDRTMMFGLVVFGLMVFFLICIPLIEAFVLFCLTKLIEKQNKPLNRKKP